MKTVRTMSNYLWHREADTKEKIIEVSLNCKTSFD